ncbi:metallopeptidase TldD-related protein [Cupriavidus basilensis]
MGNAGGSHNLTLSSSLTAPDDDFAGMLRKLGTGLLVTELEAGANYVTGKITRGCAAPRCGLLVENGVIQFRSRSPLPHCGGDAGQIVADGADRWVRGTGETGEDGSSR